MSKKAEITMEGYYDIQNIRKQLLENHREN